MLTALRRIVSPNSDMTVKSSRQHTFTTRMLIRLMQLRASQINGCAFCVDMHTREAREDDETSERLDRVVVWCHVDSFSPKERAALAWTEVLTVLDPNFRAGESAGRTGAFRNGPSFELVT